MKYPIKTMFFISSAPLESMPISEVHRKIPRSHNSPNITDGFRQYITNFYDVFPPVATRQIMHPRR